MGRVDNNLLKIKYFFINNTFFISTLDVCLCVLQNLDDSEFQTTKTNMEIAILKKKLAMYEGGNP